MAKLGDLVKTKSLTFHDIVIFVGREFNDLTMI